MNKIKSNTKSSKASKTFQVGITIPSNKILSFSLTEYAKSIVTFYQTNDFEYNLNIKVTINDVTRLVHINWNVHVRDNKAIPEKGNEKETICVISSETIFEITTFEYFHKVGNTYTIPDDLMSPMLSNALSSTRGMLTVKLENTVLSKAIIPFVDMQIFLKQMRAEKSSSIK